MTETHSPEIAVAASKRVTEPSPALGDLPDLLLVERARSKDPRALEALMRRYNRRLFRIARSILRDNDSSEDAVQEAHLRALANLDRYEPTGKFGAWLARLAFNEALMIRRRARTDNVPAEETASSLLTQAVAAGTDQGDSTQTRQLMEQAVDSLPEVFRTVFMLRVVEQLSGVETAACLGINETTVRTRLFRAQQRLRSDLARRLRSERGSLFEFETARCDRIVSRVLERMNGGGARTE
ncbi:MAG TPA: RNA polymerase sigma factor [Steroidobacteraceae bacterium]|jgi:RNA polymerase sigma-70 factor (ECF subfamily)